MPELGRLWPLAAALAVLSCGPSEEVVGPRSAALRDAPPPRLGETAAFDAALARAGPDAERLEAAKGELAARAEALRARAEALAAPVVDPATRPRLEPPAAPPAAE
ncbi:hypothetical protein [uncultured Amaricoccus sp.]|uniref:hypothetical protein n=1 Tax=uncultured Amaricoccus sp. TaxID=339341 RepID=UPI002617EBF9|nr:hypothetical protein [uncultured Amaricoccus sp.]